MYKRYRIQLFPTPEQEDLMWEHVNCCRFIWNYMLEKYNQILQDNGEFLHYEDMSRLLTIISHTKQYEFLNNVSRKSTNKVCKDLSLSLKMFYDKKKRFPHFKSKKTAKVAFPIRTEEKRFYIKNNIVKVERIGHIKTKIKNKALYSYKGKYFSGRIIRKNNKWFLSVEIWCDSQALKTTDKVLGIDLGVKDLATCSLNYEKIVFHNINKSKRVRNLERKLKHLQRVVSRKRKHKKKDEEKSKSYLKYDEMVRKIYYKLSCIRTNYVHQTTHDLCILRPKMIVMEDLDIQHMVEHSIDAISIYNQHFSEFLTFMKYKCEFYGLNFYQVSQWYPSSQICSECGARLKKKLTTKQRAFICTECGLTIDRDYNAAINLMKQGMLVLQND